MIVDNLNKQIVEAMKAHDSVRVSTLKLLLSEIKNYQIDHPQMTQEEEMAVVKKEAKKRKDAVEAYSKANRVDLADKEALELTILKEYLPEEMSDSELERLVNEAITETSATSLQEMGKVIGLVVKKSADLADGAKVSSLVRQKLS
ncbi:GatB/YqeY domain-containing protein [Candidatus Microgenomates bacterium]|nr:GatB/YqeY domain-containing protein [Candidatus Microgenomates bacterium]